jgi:hypothetical protein
MSRLSLRLVIVLLLFAFTTSAWARPTPPIPLQPFFDDCDDVELPCWYGLYISFTYIEALDPILIDAGYTLLEEAVAEDHEGEIHNSYSAPDNSELCDATVYYSTGDAHITWVSLSDCGEFYLSDVLLHFDEPNFMGMLREGNGWLHYRHGVQFNFSGGLTPESPITRIVINPPWEGGPYLQWRGYIPFWMHCVLDRYYENCWTES